MAIHKFHSFPEDHDCVMWKEAVQVAERQNCRYRYVLYQLPDFYIEIRYQRQGEPKKKMKIFSHQWRLQPYLNAIDLGNLDINN